MVLVPEDPCIHSSPGSWAILELIPVVRPNLWGSASSQPTGRVCGLVVEAGVPSENPHKHQKVKL